MLNLHIINKKSYLINELDECFNKVIHSYPLVVKDDLVYNESFPSNQIINVCYSELLSKPVIFSKDGIFIKDEDFEQICPSDDLDFGTLSVGGDLAIYHDISGLKCIDLDTNKVTTFDFDFSEVICGSFRIDNKFVAIASNDNLITYSLDGKVEGSINISGIVSLTWNPKGTWLAAATGNTVEFL